VLNAAQFAHAAQVLAAIIEGPTPADRQMDRHFRANPRLGARDRGAIAEVVYACLRRLGLPRHLVGAAGPADAWLAVHLLREGLSARALEQLRYRGGDALTAPGLAARLRALDQATLPRPVRLDLPDWLLARLDAQLGADEAEALAAALQRPAPLDLRINPLRSDRETVRARLADEGQVLEPTP
jgi:16S rRNA (cytosine967-C5)-methyltransferase